MSRKEPFLGLPSLKKKKEKRMTLSIVKIRVRHLFTLPKPNGQKKNYAALISVTHTPIHTDTHKVMLKMPSEGERESASRSSTNSQMCNHIEGCSYIHWVCFSCIEWKSYDCFCWSTVNEKECWWKTILCKTDFPHVFEIHMKVVLQRVHLIKIILQCC